MFFALFAYKFQFILLLRPQAANASPGGEAVKNLRFLTEEEFGKITPDTGKW